jgi:hypothetical protein
LQRLEYRLIWFGCSATVEDIQRFIYEHDEARPFGQYVNELIALLNPTDAQLDEAISLVQDAWNYLPHRVYRGRSPAEVMLDLQTKKPPRQRRRARKRGAAENRI